MNFAPFYLTCVAAGGLLAFVSFFPQFLFVLFIYSFIRYYLFIYGFHLSSAKEDPQPSPGALNEAGFSMTEITLTSCGHIGGMQV